MPDMLNQLHDEIDQLEDLRNRAKQIVVDVVRDELAAAIDATERAGSPSIEAAMVIIAASIEEKLAPLTTEAFKTGLSFAQKRRDANG